MNIAIVDDENECIEGLKSHIGRFFGENPLGGGGIPRLPFALTFFATETSS